MRSAQKRAMPHNAQRRIITSLYVPAKRRFLRAETDTRLSMSDAPFTAHTARGRATVATRVREERCF